MRGVRVAVVGDCMLDVYLTGDVRRISPEAPVPVVQVRGERTAPGGAANVAAALRVLGAECRLIGVVGRDAQGATLTAQLRAAGVGVDHLLPLVDRPTTTKTRVMAHRHHVVRFDRESEAELSEETARELGGRAAEAIAWAEALVLEDYDKGVLVPTVIRSSLGAAARRGVPSVADPKFRHFFEYAGAHVFKPNALELAAALGVPAVPRDPEGLAAARAKVGGEYLLLTLGDEGMALIGPDGQDERIPAVPRDVFDVSGAGDTVTATVAACLAAEASESEAARVANYAASVQVGKAGVVPVTPDEIVEAFESERQRRENLAVHEPGS